MRKSLLGENRREAEGEGFNDDDDAVTFAFHGAAKERAPLLSGAALRGTMDDLIERNPLWTIAAHAVPTEPGADPTASPTRRPTIEVCLPPDPSLSQTHHADVMAALLGRHVPADAITHRSLLAARIASPASPARADQPSSGSPTRLRLSWGRRAPSRNRSQGRPPATPAPLLRLDGVDVGGLTAVTDLEADGVLSHLLTSSDYARGFLQVSTLPLLSSPFLSSTFADIRMHHVPFLSVPFLPLLSSTLLPSPKAGPCASEDEGARVAADATDSAVAQLRQSLDDLADRDSANALAPLPLRLHHSWDAGVDVGVGGAGRGKGKANLARLLAGRSRPWAAWETRPSAQALTAQVGSRYRAWGDPPNNLPSVGRAAEGTAGGEAGMAGGTGIGGIGGTVAAAVGAADAMPPAPAAAPSDAHGGPPTLPPNPATARRFCWPAFVAGAIAGAIGVLLGVQGENTSPEGKESSSESYRGNPS